MVRIGRNYTIEEELVKKLKEESNASELVNNLLEAHFKRLNSKDLMAMNKDLDEVETTIDKLRRERDSKADAIRELEAQTENNYKKIEQKEKEEEERKEILKNVYDLIKSKDIGFDDHRIFKNHGEYEKIITSFYHKHISLEEFKGIVTDFVNNYVEVVGVEE